MYIQPEIIVVITAFAVLGMEIFLPVRSRSLQGPVTLLGLSVALAAAVESGSGYRRSRSSSHLSGCDKGSWFVMDSTQTGATYESDLQRLDQASRTADHDTMIVGRINVGGFVACG